MFTKSPDYIISEIGYPKCQESYNKTHNNTNKLYKNTQSLQQAISALSPSRLLPMRETLSEYYVRLIDKGESIAPAKQQLTTMSHKQFKNIWNENIKMKNSKRNCLDKHCASSDITTLAEREERELNAF